MLSLAAAQAIGESPYPVSRLWITLAFMLVFVAVAVATVRSRYEGQLLAEIATTLGIFLLLIGTIVYTVAFRGLHPVEVIVAWLLSAPAIAWFVMRLNRIMMRPLERLQGLGDSLRSGDWRSLLAEPESGDALQVRRALHDVAVLIEETQHTARSVLAASGNVASIGTAAADGARQVTDSLTRLAEGSDGNVQAADRITRAADLLMSAARTLDEAARETVDISTTVERRAQAGVRQAEQAMARVTEIADLARSTVERIASLRDASQRIRRITHVVGDITTQTNLLAINASIEASRAGEHGKGFGVVAEEVRGLDAESAKSLGEIETLLEDIGTRTEEVSSEIGLVDRSAAGGEEEMRRAMEVFRGIELDAQRTLEVAQSVADSSRSQAAMVGELGSASELVGRVAAGTASAVTEVSGATTRQRELTEHLRQTAT